MNKAVHALVYVILAVAIAALYFEYNLYGKKELLKDRNRQLEDTIVTLSKTIEKTNASRPASVPEARQDISPIEAKRVEAPDTKNLLEDYPAELEETNLDTMKWDDKERIQMRKLYKLDNEGKKIPDAANPGDFVKKGEGTAQEILDKLIDRAKQQLTNLNKTREELAATRKKLEELNTAFNKLPPEMRQDKITIEEKKKQIADLEAKKAELEDKISKLNTQIQDLNTEIKSLKEELQTTKDEVEALKEDVAKKEATIKKKDLYIKELLAKREGSSVADPNVTIGSKGKIVEVDNENMFAVVEFSEAAIKELYGENHERTLPNMEMGIRRNGFQGPAGEFVGRVRLRQGVAGKNLVVVDILGNWEQAKVQKGDIVFVD